MNVTLRRMAIAGCIGNESSGAVRLRNLSERGSPFLTPMGISTTTLRANVKRFPSIESSWKRSSGGGCGRARAYITETVYVATTDRGILSYGFRGSRTGAGFPIFWRSLVRCFVAMVREFIGSQLILALNHG